MDRSSYRNEHPPKVHHHPATDASFIHDVMKVIIKPREEHRRMADARVVDVAAIHDNVPGERIRPQPVHGKMLPVLLDKFTDQLRDSFDGSLVVEGFMFHGSRSLFLSTRYE